MKNSKTFVALALGCFALACPVFLPAQQDQESVADAARKAQAARKSSPPPKMVVDNDSLGSLKGTINVVGETPPPEKAEDQTKSKGSAKDEAYWRAKFGDAYKKLADDSKELDISQRERNLNQEQYYANPMATLQQEYTRKDLNDQKAKIDDLTARVAQDKANISNLEDELRQSGGEPGWASQPPQSSQTDNSSGSSQPAQPAASAPASSGAPQSGAAPSGNSNQ